MSARALNWAWSQTTRTTSQKLVLAALADRADDDGFCWPSTEWLSVKCAPMPAETVRRVLRELCEQSLLEKHERQRRRDGTYSTWMFRLPMATPTTPTGHERPVDHRSPVSAPPVMGERTEPSIEPSKNASTDVEAPTSVPAAVEVGEDSRQLVAWFVDEARKVDIQTPRRVVGQLASNIKKLLDEGQPPAVVRDGLRRMVERRLVQPALLPNFVMEAQIPQAEAMRYGRGMTTAQILAQYGGQE